MSYLDCLLTAFVALRSNLMRSVLTALGIIIGVAAVIAMVAIGAGAEQRVQSVIQNLGTNLLIVVNGSRTSGGRRTGSGTKPSLTEGDALALTKEIEAVQYSGASVGGSGQVVAGNSNWFTVFRGVANDYLDARDWAVETGRGFTPAEQRSAAKVVILGKTVALNLFGDSDPIGQSVRVNRVPFVVAGVFRAKGQSPSGMDQDDVIMMPLSSAKKRVLGGRQVRGDLVGTITVKVRSTEEVADVEEQAKDLLRRRHKIRDGQPDDFYVRNLAEMLEARAESSRIMAILLASVAGVSLIVGGIGIMNIMLVSVTERTSEIGLRMALGARSRDVMAQFVIEAVSLSIIGGLIGVMLGVAGSLLLAHLGEWPMLIDTEAILMAVAFSAAVGIFFGYYPARKAAALDPIIALRHE
ncbi:MAG: FtsX-like permease family protein [Alphaproteobacteria bacterium]|nr:FtsX-like permease family protein [Alphaproteobacteria bacterium]